MEAIIHQPLGNVIYCGRIFHIACVNNALMRHPAMIAAIQDREVGFQTGGNVVGIKNGDFGRFR